ncbi:GspH/FimT family protein [Phytopseudomonas dryadis]|uniref:Type II secretion system protein H n=1 Tax=Phytopseudomonas dryadis TaxID=2487520 RepID=A0ABY1Z7K5_9GAMM|nr:MULTISPECIES: GspH/FimT family pseudopilin [Pseudomonas]TBV04701.1 fimbrial biogenesis protein FimT [Pseudomonas dryadis]TBV17212.1 fimbrial biogenesis protein FimT [Pseudomonas sp. FRB 230]
MNRDQQKALSLFELLVTTGLLAIALALGLPAFEQLAQANRSQTIHDQLKASLHLARTHSISQGRTVELCGSSGGHSCDHAWQGGWLIREQSSAQAIHNVRLSQHEHLAWKGLSKPIRFRPTGHSNASNGTFTFCSQDGQPLWQIVLNRQGRARTAKANQLRANACETR